MMKKQSLRKIIASVSLSLCLALSAGVALTNVDSNGYASASSTVAGSAYANLIEAKGAGSVAAVTTEAQLNNNSKSFTGLKLTGKTDAVFNLGMVNIASSDWAGSYTAPAAETTTDKNNSLIELVFAPHDNNDMTTSDGGGSGELSGVIVTFTQGDKSMQVQFNYYNYTGPSNDEITISAKGNNQTKFGGYRDGKGYMFESGVRKTRIKSEYASYFGYTGEQKTSTSGYANIPASVYYDFNDNALYTPLVYRGDTPTDLGKSYLIRDFDSTDNGANRVGSSATNFTEELVIWNGFTKDATGRCMVDVSVKFKTVTGESASSIIITKLGNVTIGDSITVADSDVGVYPVVNTIDTAVVNTPVSINMPSKKGCSFTGVQEITEARSLVVSYNGQVVETVTNIVDNKATFTPANTGVYTLKTIVNGIYEEVLDISVVDASYGVSTAGVASAIKTSQGATATYGSATSRAGTFKGIVLKGGSGATFTYENIDISRLKYNNANDYNSLLSLIAVPRATTKAVAIYEDLNGDGVISFSDLDIDNDNILDTTENDFDNDGIDDDVEGEDEVTLGEIVYDIDGKPTEDNADEIKFKKDALKRIKELKTLDKSVKHGGVYYGRELDGIEITITSVSNPDVYITMLMSAAEYREDSAAEATSVVKVRAYNQGYSAYRNKQSSNYYTSTQVEGYAKNMCPKNFSFTGLNTNELDLIYDFDKNIMYTNNEIVHSASGNSAVLRDFGVDLTTVPKGQTATGPAFEGFADGNVNITIKFGNITGVGDTIKVHSDYTGVSTSKYVNYVDANDNGYADNEGSYDDTSVVLTSLFGMDLTVDNSVRTAVNDEIVSTSEKVVGYYGLDIATPEIIKQNVYMNDIDFSATYKVLDAENNVVSVGGQKLEGVYQAGTTFKLNKLGSYKYVVTDSYGLTTTVPVEFNPRLKLDFGANFSAKINGVSYKDGDVVLVDEDLEFEFDTDYGYSIGSIKFMGADLTAGSTVAIDKNQFFGSELLVVRAVEDEYTITYKMREDATYEETETFSILDVYNKTALLNPTVIDGKRFIGWFIEEEQFKTFADTDIRDITVYGVYGPEVYYVSFDDGSGNVSTQIINKDGTAVAFAPEKDGYVFNGWVDKNGNVYDFNATISQDVELVAKWSKVDGLVIDEAEVADSNVKASPVEYKEPVNVLQIVFIILFVLGILGTAAAVVLAVLKKAKNNEENVVDEEV